LGKQIEEARGATHRMVPGMIVVVRYRCVEGDAPE
jgi:hypothetical protein